MKWRLTRAWLGLSMAALGSVTFMVSLNAHAFDPTLRLHPLRVATDLDVLINDIGRVVIPPVGRHVGDTAAGHAFIQRPAPDGSDNFELRDRETGAVRLTLIMLDQAEGGRSKTFAGRTAAGAPVTMWGADGNLLAELPPNVLGKEEGRLDAIENMFRPKKPRVFGIDGEGVAGFSGDKDNVLLFPNGWQVRSADFKSTYFKGEGVWIGFRNNGHVSLIDVDRRARVDTSYTGIDYFGNTLIATKVDNKRKRLDHWIIDRNGKAVLGPFDHIVNFDAERALVIKGSAYEVMTVPAHERFTGASGYLFRDPSNRPLLRVFDPTKSPPRGDDGSFGYRNADGALVVPIKYKLAIESPVDGVYTWQEWQWDAKHKGNYFIAIDSSGTTILDAREPDTVDGIPNARGWPVATAGAVLMVVKSNEARLYSVNAKTYSAPVKLNGVSGLHGELMVAATAKGAGLMNRKAKFVVEPTWPTLTNSGNLWAFAPSDETGVKPDGKPTGYIDSTGQVVARLAKACGAVIVIDGKGQRIWPSDAATCSEMPKPLTHAPR